eukprot:scaffold79381_cov62-Phaeocystis_antarctica.AAC.1
MSLYVLPCSVGNRALNPSALIILPLTSARSLILTTPFAAHATASSSTSRVLRPERRVLPSNHPLKKIRCPLTSST